MQVSHAVPAPPDGSLNISIAMATFNGGAFIEQQLQSLARQTKLPVELIISDDGSTDNTLTLAEVFASTAPFPVHIHRNEKRQGYRANFMQAAGLCSAALIAFCDQDDIWHEEKLLEVSRYFDDSEVLLVHHNTRVINRDGMPIEPLLRPGAHAAVSEPLSTDPWIFALGFCQMFRRSLLAFSDMREHSIDFYFADQHLAHDQWFFFLASVFGRIVYIERELADYRQHGGNTYGVQANKMLRIFTRLQEKLNNSGLFYERLAAVAANRVMILNTIATTAGNTPRFHERAVAAARQYHILSEWLDSRAQIYRKRWLANRLALWCQLLRGSAYGSTAPWSFDRKAAMRDAVMGVLLGPAIERIKTRLDRRHSLSESPRRSNT